MRARPWYTFSMQTSPDVAPASAGWTGAGHALACLALVLVVVAVFLPVLGGGFVYDDLWLAAQNPSLRGFDALVDSLGSSYWDFLDARSSAYVGYWRPLTSIALFVGHGLGDGSPQGFHIVSLALHTIAVLLAFAFAKRLTRDPWLALAAAALFGLHPVVVEPVAWISSVNDPLQAIFCLCALLTFQRWRERGSVGVPIATALSWLAALLAKESAVALIALIVAVDIARRDVDRSTPLRERMKPVGRAYGSLLAAFALYYVARIAVFGDLWAGFDRTTGQLGLTAVREVSLRLELFGGALALMVWPASLNLFRDMRPEIGAFDPQLWRAIFCIVAWALALRWAWKRGETAIAAALWIVCAALLPALLRIEALGRFALSERFLYLSCLGFALALVLAVDALAKRLSLSRLGLLALTVLAVAYAWRARERTHDWKDERTLFARSFADNPRSPYVAWGLGRVLLEDYRRSQDLPTLTEARDAFLHSQELGLKREDGTRDGEVLVTEEDRLQANLGLAWYYFFAALRNFDETTLDEAAGVFQRTQAFFPRSYEALTGLGVVRMAQDQLPDAAARLREALDLNPKHLEAWYYLGRLEQRRGDSAAARAAFEAALALNPDDVDTLALYAGLLGEAGEQAKARAALDRAYALAPRDPAVLMGLGMLAAKNRDGGGALRWFDEILKVDPAYAPALVQKGKVLIALTQFDRALASLQRACELAPRDFEAHYTLGVLLLNQGMNAEALPYLSRALELGPEHPLAADLRAKIAELSKS